MKYTYRVVGTPGMRLIEYFRQQFEPLYEKARKEDKKEQEATYDPDRMTEQQEKEMEELRKKYQVQKRGKDKPKEYGS